MRNKAIFFLFLISLSFYRCETNTFTYGKKIYDSVCANCHMENGEGLGELIPPLAQSDYMKNNRNLLPCIVVNGINEEIVVNGKTYKEQMAGMKNIPVADLTNVLNYINNSWGNNNGIYRLDEVQQMLKNCR